MYNPISHIVYAAIGSDVRDVIISGKIIIRDKRLLTLDLEDILTRANLLGDSIGDSIH
jgi:5-methylthioadenosine/S-adenosylhomocysteine deaminase